MASSASSCDEKIETPHPARKRFWRFRVFLSGKAMSNGGEAGINFDCFLSNLQKYPLKKLLYYLIFTIPEKSLILMQNKERGSYNGKVC